MTRSSAPSPGTLGNPPSDSFVLHATGGTI
jgi:hypothetical protein